MADGSIPKSGKTTISTVAGVTLASLGKPDVNVEYNWSEFATVEEMEAAGETPSKVDILAYVNSIRERNALSSARASKISEFTEEVRNSPEFKRSEFIKAAVAFGMTQEQAEQLASSKLTQ